MRYSPLFAGWDFPAHLTWSSLNIRKKYRQEVPSPMAQAVKPIPDGYHSVTPYLIIDNGRCNEALDFYARAFGAKEVMRMPRPDGGVAHAEIQLGNSRVMLADEALNTGAYGPHHFCGSPVTLHVYLPDVDATTHRAVDAGARLVRPLEDQFYGDRSAGLEDPFGHKWSLSTHVRDVSIDEMKQHMHESVAA
jgi:PhnB protein